MTSSSSKMILGGWYYPSAPCWPDLDLLHKYKGLNQLCGEFLRFTLNTYDDGSCIEVMDEENYGIGGYSKNHVKQLVSSVDEPYCTISGRSESGVTRMLEDDDLKLKTIEKIVKFCVDNKLHADMNIEGLASFSQEECHKHIDFLNELGVALKKAGRKYRVVTVAEDGTLFHGKWRNDLLKDVTCDYIVCMQYDRMYDFGRVGICPLDFLRKTTENIKKSIGKSWPEKYICGLPNYGYKAYIANEYKVELLTKGQLAKKGIIDLPSDNREHGSCEITWEGTDTVRNGESGGVYYFYSDQKALDEKTKVMLELGVNKFSVWHMFGQKDGRDTEHINPWWSNDMIEKISGCKMPEEEEKEPTPKPEEKEPTPKPEEKEPTPKPQPPVEPVVLKKLHIEGIEITNTRHIIQIIKYIKKITNMNEITYLIEHKK